MSNMVGTDAPTATGGSASDGRRSEKWLIVDEAGGRLGSSDQRRRSMVDRRHRADRRRLQNRANLIGRRKKRSAICGHDVGQLRPSALVIVVLS